MARWFGLLLLIGLILGLGGAAHGQAPAGRRWLADPALLQAPRYAPGGYALAMVDAQEGWGAAGNVLFRFDGRHWRVDQSLPWEGDVRSEISSISFADRSHGWAGGATWYRTTPTIKLGRYDGSAWTWTNEFRGKNGRMQTINGIIEEVKALPGGQALALGTELDRTRLFKYDGAAWSDITPPAWQDGQFLTHFALESATEGWAGGWAGNRPLLSQLQGGVWQDVALPDLGDATYVAAIQLASASEAWVLINGPKLADRPCTGGSILRYRDGAWTIVAGEQRSISAFALIPGTDQGWVSLDACGAGAESRPAERQRFDAGRLLADPQGATLVPRAYGLLDAEHQYAAAGGNFLRWSDERLPTAPIADPQAPGTRFFPATGHSLEGVFLDYYASHGLDLGDDGVSERESLALFGYPISQPFPEINPDTGEVLQVQYFERARMEHHPLNQAPHDVLLGRLTVPALHRRNIVPARPSGPVPAGCARNEVTRFDLCPPLRDFWARNGATPVFGHPLSQARPELSQTDGQTYSTQYFERGRMEHHPEHQGTQYEVLLGLLGSEELQARGYLPR